jgi:hypothetical protein
MGTSANDPGKGKPEKNPYGVAESTLAYTWDWGVKVPWEGLEKVKGGTALAPAATGSAPNVNGLATPGGSGSVGFTRERTVPKISVNVPGRRSSTLSSVTPGPGASLSTRLPGTPGNMLPPPIPTHVQTAATNGSSSTQDDYTILDSYIDDAELKTEVQSPMDLAMDTPTETEVKPTRTLSLKLPPRMRDTSVNDHDILAIADPLESAITKAGTGPSTGNAALDADIDADIAEVMGDAKDDVDEDIAEVLGDPQVESDEDVDVDADADADVDVDAYIADALGPDASPTVERNSMSIQLTKALDRPSQADLELEQLLETSASPRHDIDIDMLGMVPEPPGEGSAFILSDLDYLPASDAGTLAFASSTTLPLATSAFRSTTTPLPVANASHISLHTPIMNGAAPVKSEESLHFPDETTPSNPLPPTTTSQPPA